VHLALLAPSLCALAIYAMVQMEIYIANHVMPENLEHQVTEVLELAIGLTRNLPKL
jgi:hypothetical protein